MSATKIVSRMVMEQDVHQKVENAFMVAHLATQQLFVLKTFGGSPAAAIGGGVAGGVILIIAIIGVIAFLLLKKRRAGNSYKETTTLKTDQNEEQHVDSSAVYATVTKNNDEDAIAREIAIRFEENGRVYYNNANEVNKTKVKVEELPTYVTAKTKSSYEDEFEKGKCDQYWPNVGSSARYGNVNVTCLSEDEYAEFTRRTFHISQEQYQFLHRALVHSLTLDCNPVKGESYQQFLDSLNDGDRAKLFQSVGSYFPADNPVLKKGAFNVKSLRQDGTIFYTNRTLMLEATGQNKETVMRSIPHLAFTAWDSSKNTPRSATEFLDFINYVEEASRTSASRGPILIHCISIVPGLVMLVPVVFTVSDKGGLDSS
ncbi:hypothetical protein MAR_032574 [Mya arenaria]|uniref:Tyrosine-protein phosphatase domain-containing protein n=1 Tax=Mya arenaria TaxID=6604 RepID=A0ABY7F7N6_MYAAR|nr:hypothetical protein MAR_032574 [Mya arenaria]